jgi:2,3-bisphosphoglycerate-independent phosphoglycerate mutase
MFARINQLFGSFKKQRKFEPATEIQQADHSNSPIVSSDGQIVESQIATHDNSQQPTSVQTITTPPGYVDTENQQPESSNQSTANNPATAGVAQAVTTPSNQTSASLFPSHVPTPIDIQPIISSKEFNDTFLQSNYKGVKPVALLILDGWGIGPNNAGNAIARASTPNMDKYWLSYPHTQLAASGQAVGLPAGEDGNTETGHLNIGAGHIVYQDLPRINMSIADGGFYNNQAFANAVAHVKKNNSVIHLIGLIGSGGVHSNIEHLYALLNYCKQQDLTEVYIHGFTDGRDSPPTSGINYVQQIIDHCETLGLGKIASLVGRYYAMDRDKKWERIEKAYNALVLGDAEQCVIDPIGAMKQQYDNNITDEFIEPINICDNDGSKRLIQDNDAVIFFNYRIDRPRELTRAFVMPDFESGISSLGFDPYTEKYEKTNIQQGSHIQTFQRQKVLKNLYFATMTMYEEDLPVDVAFPPQNIKNPLCKVLAEKGLRQLRMTETEKERFVTYYMNGQQDTLYPGEDRVILPSRGVKSYDQAPEMSTPEIGKAMVERIQQDKYDVIIANLCNGDMVGHTGNLEATVRACEILDGVLGKIVDEIIVRGGVVLITADHGNAEEMINNETGGVDTEHSTYPVPLMIIGKQFGGKSVMLPTGILADIAPTMLKILGISKPNSMTGRALI